MFSWRFYSLFAVFFILILFLSLVLFSPLTPEYGFMPAVGMVVEQSSFDIDVPVSVDSSVDIFDTIVYTDKEDGASSSSSSWFLNLLLSSFFVFAIILTLLFVIRSSRFEDRFVLSPDEASKVSMASYILKERRNGHSDKTIANHLVNHGYDSLEVMNALLLMNQDDDVKDVAEFFSKYAEFGCDLNMLEKEAIKIGIEPVVVRSAKESALAK
jgi:hypothetical protein